LLTANSCLDFSKPIAPQTGVSCRQVLCLKWHADECERMFCTTDVSAELQMTCLK